MDETETHDIVEATVDGETLRGVVRRNTQGRDGPVVKVELPRTHDAAYGEHLGGDAFVDGTELLVTPDHVTLVARPDVSGIHPQNYSVDRHLELAERQGRLG